MFKYQLYSFDTLVAEDTNILNIVNGLFIAELMQNYKLKNITIKIIYVLLP